MHYFPFTLSVFAVQYFLLLYLRLYILRIFCSLISVYPCLQLITYSLLIIMCNYFFFWGMFRLMFYCWPSDCIRMTVNYSSFIGSCLLPTFHNLILQSSLFIVTSAVFETKYEECFTTYCIRHWTLFTTYSSQSDSSVFLTYLPVSRF